MKSNLHPQRCHRGRKGKMAPSNQQEDEGRRERGLWTSRTEDGERSWTTRRRERWTRRLRPRWPRGGRRGNISTKEAGQTEGRRGGGGYQDRGYRDSGFQSVAITVATVAAIRGGVTVASRHLHTQEVDTRVVDISRTIDTKMVGITVIEAGSRGERVVEARAGQRWPRRRLGRKRSQNYHQGGQFEQHFQHGGYQYNHSGFGQGRHYTSWGYIEPYVLLELK